jgi:hypothetical protein
MAAPLFEFLSLNELDDTLISLSESNGKIHYRLSRNLLKIMQGNDFGQLYTG